MTIHGHALQNMRPMPTYQCFDAIYYCCRRTALALANSAAIACYASVEKMISKKASGTFRGKHARAQNISAISNTLHFIYGIEATSRKLALSIFNIALFHLICR